MASNVKSFVKQVLAQLQGNEDQVVAEKNYRKATSAVKGQISSLESKQVDAEIALDEAKEALHSAKYPTKLIKDTSDYVRNVAKKQEAVDSAQEELESINESLKFFTKLNKEFDS